MSKKYLPLEARVFYNEEHDFIEIVSKDEVLEKRPFRLSMKQGTQADKTLREVLFKRGFLKDDPSHTLLPEKGKILSNDYVSMFGINIGVMDSKNDLYIPHNGHTVIVGRVGSGVSIFGRLLITQSLNSGRKVIGYDPRQLELEEYSSENFEHIKDPEPFLNSIEQLKNDVLAGKSTNTVLFIESLTAAIDQSIDFWKPLSELMSLTNDPTLRVVLCTDTLAIGEKLVELTPIRIKAGNISYREDEKLFKTVKELPYIMGRNYIEIHDGNDVVLQKEFQSHYMRPLEDY